MSSIQIDIPYDVIDDFCRQHAIRKLSLFGSVMRDDFRPDSDVDVLVEFDSDKALTYFDLVDIQVALESLLKRKVDLREPVELSQYWRRQVMEKAVILYERT
jgi:uncharacterized protein